MLRSRRWGGWSSSLLIVTLMYAPAGLAQIYGFVDGDGVAHFAAEAIDERYKRVGSGQLPGPLQAAGGKTSQRSAGHSQRQVAEMMINAAASINNWPFFLFRLLEFNGGWCRDGTRR